MACGPNVLSSWRRVSHLGSISAAAALVTVAIVCAEARAEFAYEERTDKLTDKATMQAIASVAVSGTRYDIVLECIAVSNWPQSHAMVPGIAVRIATFDEKSGNGKAISAEGRALIKTSKGLGVHFGRAITIRIDKAPAFEVGGALVQYSNRVEFWLDERKKALLLASSVLLIKGVVGEDLIELETTLSARFREHPSCRALQEPSKAETTSKQSELVELRNAAKRGENFADFLRRTAFKRLLERALGPSFEDLTGLMTISTRPELISNRYIWFTGTGCGLRTCPPDGAAIVVDTQTGGVYVVTVLADRTPQQPFNEYVTDPNPALVPAVHARLSKWKADHAFR